jgi:hypothetical protein
VGQDAAGFGTSGQGAEGSKPVPDFAGCDGSDAAGWLGGGEEADVEDVGKVGKVATDRCLDESELGSAGLIAAAAGSLDVLIRLAAGSRSRPEGQGLKDLA